MKSSTSSSPKRTRAAAYSAEDKESFKDELPVLKKRSPSKSKHIGASTSSPKKQQLARPQVVLPAIGTSITYHDDDPSQVGVDTGEELEVLKAILVREGYLQRLHQKSQSGRISGNFLGETIDVLDLLRISTLDVVERIAKWRKRKAQLQLALEPATPTTDPSAATSVVPCYKWNEFNYLLKLPSDLDFLQKHTGLIQWLGFSLLRNPFVLPVNLDTRNELIKQQQIQEELSASSSSSSSLRLHHRAARAPGTCPGMSNDPHSARNGDESSFFVQIGGKRSIDSISNAIDQQTALWQNNALLLAEKKRAKNPYETRVLNDEDLVPLNATKTPAQLQEEARLKASKAKSRSIRANATPEMPSQIGDIEMTRIYEAERLMLEEEAAFGRFTYDAQGKLIPAQEASRRAQMSDLSGGLYNHFFGLQGSDGPSTMMAASSTSIHGPAQFDLSDLTGNQIAKKKAGLLGPLAKPECFHFQLVPMKKSRGVQLEEALELEKTALGRFEQLIESLREEIECKEMEIAHMESFPRVTLYPDELHEFRAKARRVIKDLRRQMNEKLEILHKRREKIQRKQEIVQIFKFANKSAVDVVRSARIEASRQEAARVAQESSSLIQKSLNNQKEQENAPPLIHHLCAIQIQKIARGMITRVKYENLQVEYDVASKYIQSVVRGFLARRRVAKLFWRKNACLVIQRFARGMLARRLVKRKRRDLLMLRSLVRIQKTIRGFLGRVRMKKVRVLLTARQELIRSVAHLTANDLKELASACGRMVALPSLLVVNADGSVDKKKSNNKKDQKEFELSALVLGLVRIVMLFTSSTDKEPHISQVRWQESCNFLNRGMKLVRQLQQLARACEAHHLRVSALGNALLRAYQRDVTFCRRTFEQLPCAQHAAIALFEFVTAFATVTKLQQLVKPFFSGVFSVDEVTNERDRAMDLVEEEENRLLEESHEKQFVPVELIHGRSVKHHGTSAANPRIRPVLLVLSLDLPHCSREVLLRKVLMLFPGLFLVLSPSKFERTNGMDYNAIQQAFELGYSVIVESDIGLTKASQRHFVGIFSAIQAALRPVPFSILVKASLKNRQGVLDAISNQLWLTKDPIEAYDKLAIVQQQQQQQQQLQQPKPHEDVNKLVTGETPKRITDWTLKKSFEIAAELLFQLCKEPTQRNLQQLSALQTAKMAQIIVMEAVIVLLTPSRQYEGPKESMSAVSWRISRRLLADAVFLTKKLKEVRVESVSMENLGALEKYLAHPDWPVDSLSLAQSNNALFLLSRWVEAMVRCVHVVNENDGVVATINRKHPVAGLFSSVVTFSNVDPLLNTFRTDVDEDEVEVQRAMEQQGESLALLEVMESVLSDRLVFRKCRKLDDRYCFVNVYHDCQRVFFTAYDPKRSQRWSTMILQHQINTLLAPNSLEHGHVRVPPQDSQEMYRRLADLVVLVPLREANKLISPPKSYRPARDQDQEELEALLAAQTAPMTQQVANSSEKSASTTKAKAKTKAVAKHEPHHLVVRPPVIRLFRKSLRLGGKVSTVTISELNRGRIQVHAFLHNTHANALECLVSLESILERMNNQQARDRVVNLEQIPKMVLDRMHLFRRVISQQNDNVALSQEDKREVMRLVVRPREESRGRLILRRAFSMKDTAGTILLSIYKRHEQGGYLVEFYDPRSCNMGQVVVSQRNFQDYVLFTDFAKSKTICQSTAQLFHGTVIDSERSSRGNRGGIKSQRDREGTIPTRFRLCRSLLSLPFVANPFLQEPKRVWRVYVQVDNPSHAEESAMKFYFVWPQSCRQELIELRDEQIEPFFQESWTTARRFQRVVMARQLLKAFWWDDTIQKVVAVFPYGRFDSKTVTRTSQRSVALSAAAKMAIDDQEQPVQNSGVQQVAQESDWIHSGQCSRAQSPSSATDPIRIPSLETIDTSSRVSTGTNVSSCTLLLDDLLTNNPCDFRSAPRTRHCYLYDKEELLSKGSHRSNGVLLMVEVFMKAIVVDTLVVAHPVDRVRQQDSFVLRFEFYLPSISSHQTLLVNGIKDLREVVGPDHATLISSQTVKRMVQFVVQNRTEVSVVREEVADVAKEQTEGPEDAILEDPGISSAYKMRATKAKKYHEVLKVDFLRHRLYDKTKATPVTNVAIQDQHYNVAKLIDQREERGLKILSMVRRIDGRNVTLTVFDVGATRHHTAKSLIDDFLKSSAPPAIRVDAYVSDTSSAASLLLEGIDLANAVGEQVALLNDPEKRRDLALHLIAHIGLEIRHDGQGMRLFITDYFVAPDSVRQQEKASFSAKAEAGANAAATGTETRKLLSKGVRLVDGEKVWVSLYLWSDGVLDLAFYEPQSSLRCDLKLPKATVSVLFGVEDFLLTSASILPKQHLQLSLSHICSFVRLEKVEIGELHDHQELRSALVIDMEKANCMRQRFLSDNGDPPAGAVIGASAHVDGSLTPLSKSRSIVTIEAVPLTRQCCIVRSDQFFGVRWSLTKAPRPALTAAPVDVVPATDPTGPVEPSRTTVNPAATAAASSSTMLPPSFDLELLCSVYAPSLGFVVTTKCFSTSELAYGLHMEVAESCESFAQLSNAFLSRLQIDREEEDLASMVARNRLTPSVLLGLRLE